MFSTGCSVSPLRRRTPDTGNIARTYRGVFLQGIQCGPSLHHSTYGGNMATKIKHVAIRTTSTEKAKLMADFYGTLFDMNRDNRTTDGYVWASLGSRGWARQAGPDHFGFIVD